MVKEALAAQNLPNVIFLNVNMPGKVCLTELKKHKKLSSIRVVVLSTTANAKEILDFKKLGAEFLHKEGQL